jgi:hypothetical protein
VVEVRGRVSIPPDASIIPNGAIESTSTWDFSVRSHYVDSYLGGVLQWDSTQFATYVKKARSTGVDILYFRQVVQKFG